MKVRKMSLNHYGRIRCYKPFSANVIIGIIIVFRIIETVCFIESKFDFSFL